jgi:hypothetical protein
MRYDRPRWSAILGCGHDARMPGRPEPGSWITCTEMACQAQQRVTSVTPVPADYGAPAPGRPGIQEPLWADDGEVAA